MAASKIRATDGNGYLVALEASSIIALRQGALREVLAEQATPPRGGGFSSSKLRSNNASARAEYCANALLITPCLLRGSSTICRDGPRLVQRSITLSDAIFHGRFSLFFSMSRNVSGRNNGLSHAVPILGKAVKLWFPRRRNDVSDAICFAEAREDEAFVIRAFRIALDI